MKLIKNFKHKISKNINKLISNIVLLEDWYEIRNDFLEIYKQGLRSNKIGKKIKNKNSLFWYSNTLKIRDYAKDCHPLETSKCFCEDILQNLDFIEDFYSKLQNLLSIFIIFGILITLLSIPIISYIFALFSVIILFLKLLFRFIISIINTEEELIENITNHLMLTENEITSKKHNLNEMVAGFIWNRSLLNYKKNIPILEFFIIIKYVSKRFYRSIMYGLSIFILEYLDNGRSIKSLMKVAPNIFKFCAIKEK